MTRTSFARTARKLLPGVLLASAALTAAPALAGPVLNGGPAVAPTLTSGAPGTLVTTTTFALTGTTFDGTLYAAVYQDAVTGYLDFVYQVARTGAGSSGTNDVIERLTAGSFAGVTVDAYEDATGGWGPFITASNTGGDSALIKLIGNTLSVDFGNVLGGSDVSGVYIFKTDAPTIKAGTFGMIDSSVLGGNWLAPALPEPATWAMMLLGFGGIGFVMRRKNAASHIAQIA